MLACRARLALNGDEVKRIVVDPTWSFETLLSELQLRFPGLDIAKVTVDDGVVVEHVRDVQAGDTLLVWDRSHDRATPSLHGAIAASDIVEMQVQLESRCRRATRSGLRPSAKLLVMGCGCHCRCCW